MTGSLGIHTRFLFESFDIKDTAQTVYILALFGSIVKYDYSKKVALSATVSFFG